MPSTLTKIETINVGAGGQASITFSNIPQTYSHLMIKLSGRKTGTDVEVVSLVVNGGGTAINANRYLDSNNSGTPRSGNVSGYQVLAQPSDYTANVFGSAEIFISNFTASQHKVISADSVLETNAVGSYAALTASVWPSTAAITSLSLSPLASSWAQHTTATLYGILKA